MACPFILSETGASFQSNILGNTVRPSATQTQLAIKQNWWNNILALATGPKYPNWKAALWFEETKSENAFSQPGTLVTKDYRITTDATVKAALLADLATLNNKIVYAGTLKLTCDGRLAF